MKITYISLMPPYPPNNGVSMRNYLFLRALALEGHRVSLISFTDSASLTKYETNLRELCEQVRLVRVSDAPGSIELWARLRALRSPHPYGAWRFRSEELRAAIADQIRRRDVDLIICDGVYQIQNLPPGPLPPVLLNEPSLTHEELRRYLAHEHNPLKLAYGWLEYRKLRDWETRACSSVSGVIACSQRDREVLEELCPGAKVSVVPNCIDTDSYSPADDDDGKTLLFVGAMDWLPNRDAVDFFVSAILPELRRLRPDVNFVVAGRNPPQAFARKFAGVPGLRFTGTVPDLRPLLARAAVCVVPLRIGSGTRIKILEAAAMGKAVVSTTIGAEGLDLVNGQEIVLADNPGLFADKIASLLGNVALRRGIGAAARKRIDRDYSLFVLRNALGTVMACGQPSLGAIVDPAVATAADQRELPSVAADALSDQPEENL